MLDIDIGQAQRTKSQEFVCGDDFLILNQTNEILIALADGLGHGENAARAARMAMRHVELNAALTPEEILSNCHLALKGTRGCQMAIMRIQPTNGHLPKSGSYAQMSFAGIGNVRLDALSVTHIRPLTSIGIVGYRFRRIPSYKYLLHPGDLIIFYTDGITKKIDLSTYQSLSSQVIAQRILNEHGSTNDDATILVLRVGKSLVS